METIEGKKIMAKEPKNIAEALVSYPTRKSTVSEMKKYPELEKFVPKEKRKKSVMKRYRKKLNQLYRERASMKEKMAAHREIAEYMNRTY